jgi:WhiB family redox-sensing transcriptional regulator
MIGSICSSGWEVSARREPHWSEHAACMGLDLYLFFGPPTDIERGMARESVMDRREREGQALAVCQGCPVRALCLETELALPADQQFGIYGGKTEYERQQMIYAAEARTRAPRRPRIRAKKATPTAPPVSGAPSAPGTIPRQTTGFRRVAAREETRPARPTT